MTATLKTAAVVARRNSQDGSQWAILRIIGSKFFQIERFDRIPDCRFPDIIAQYRRGIRIRSLFRKKDRSRL